MRPSAVVFAFCGLLVAAQAAVAQDAAADAKMKRVEITSFVMMGGGNGIGAAVRWPLIGQLSAEVEASQRYAEINAPNVTFSLLYDLPTVGIVTPYVAGGVGVEQYGYAVGVPTGGVLQMTGTALAVNAGGGVRVPIDEKWGVRTDVRYFKPFARQARERMRIYNGVTFKP